MPQGYITKRLVDTMTPQERMVALWDSGDRSVKGFGLLCLPSGRKSYVYQYRIGGRSGKTNRVTIGQHGSPWTVDQARARAREIGEQVRRGIDPNEAKRDQVARREQAKLAERERERIERDLAFDVYADRFITQGMLDAKDKTRLSYRQTLDYYVCPFLNGKPLPAISRTEIIKVLDNIPADKPAVRRLVFAVIRRLFNWARSRGDIVAVPFDGMPAPRPAPSRDRVLTDAELRAALLAIATFEPPFGPFFQMLFATGQRREEVAGMDWQEVDQGTATWILPSRRSKNDDANIVPLNAHAAAALDKIVGSQARGQNTVKPTWPSKGLIFTHTGETPISGFSKAKARLDGAMLDILKKDILARGDDPDDSTLEPWRLHDARRTLATGLQRLGIRFEVTEAVLNHRSGRSQSGIAAVYQRHGWSEEKRAALNAWSAFCDDLLKQPEDVSDVGNLI